MAKSTRTTKKPETTSGETATDARTTSRSRTAKPSAEPTTSNGGIDRAAIARRAYELFQARGGQHGYEIEDWLQAERELTGRQDQR